MKKNGFTLVEVLAVLIVLGFLLVLTVPAYLTVLKDARRDNYISKVSEIEVAATKYGETIKDEVKAAGTGCYTKLTIAKLIEMGEITSDSEKQNVIINPTDNKPLTGSIWVCYNTTKFDIASFYVTTFNTNSIYHEGDKVTSGTTIYKCLHDYPGKGGLNATYVVNKGKSNEMTLPYFEAISR